MSRWTPRTAWNVVAHLASLACFAAPFAACAIRADEPAGKSAANAAAASSKNLAAQRLFAVKILPLLKSKCFACHGDDPRQLKAKYDMRTRDALLRGGESHEPAVVPGHPEQSPLFQAVRWDGLEMPPKKNDRLNAEQIEMLRAWIAAGAPWPSPARRRELLAQDWSAQSADGVRVATSGGLSDDWTRRRYQKEDLWAFRPIRDVEVPWSALPPGASRNPIDAFVQRRLAAKNLSPAARADKRTLIRRATYDLTGLPPTAAEIAAFLRDDSPQAFQTVVRRLLDSKHYGEQMARHWLDVVRYADTSGFANDYERPNAWRYRDYVIRAFNQDKPYDRFVVEQIAGDELDPNDPENLIAVGFLRMGPWEHTGMSVETVTRQLFLDDVTNTVGQTFLAMNMTCCRCHDHKFDPLPTRDYYRLQAVFAPTQFADRATPFQPYENTRGFDSGRERVRLLMKQAQDYLAQLNQQNQRTVDQLLKQRGVKSVQELQPALGNPKFYGLSDQEKSLQKITNKRVAYFQRALARYEPYALSVYNGPFPGYRGIQNRAVSPPPPEQRRRGELPEVHILAGGALEAPRERVEPGVLSLMPVSFETERPQAAAIPASANGRRLALARWIASEENTLTARVIVNRVWQWHFGVGLAPTSNAFGKMGQKPSHPELLDYLAKRFMREGWSLKKLHALIMDSETYARGGRPPHVKAAPEADPDNRLLAWFPPRRLAAEELRDSLLAVTGELNGEMGGPGVYPEINWDVALQPRHIMGSVAAAYQPSVTPEQRNRRTIYAFRYRTLADPFLEVFNRPGTEFSCERRDATTVTSQVFALFNSRFAQSRSVALAAAIAKRTDDPAQRVGLAFRRVYGRQATAEELLWAGNHVKQLTAHHRRHPAPAAKIPQKVTRSMVEELTGEPFEFVEELTLMKDYQRDLSPGDVDAATRALADLCLVLMNSNEFVYVY